MSEVVRGQTFNVGKRYSNLEFIGEGAYGMVVYVGTSSPSPPHITLILFYRNGMFGRLCAHGGGRTPLPPSGPLSRMHSHPPQVAACRMSSLAAAHLSTSLYQALSACMHGAMCSS